MSETYSQIDAFLKLVEWTGGWDLDEDVERALSEDLGKRRHDVTSEALLDKATVGRASMVARESGVLAGAVLLNEVALHAPARVAIELVRRDGDRVEPGDAIAHYDGPLRDILKIERTSLNYVTHLSGIATLTARYVEQTAGTRAKVYDTRKTLPGLRWLQKYAVTCGGGATHRLGLYDAMLVKDNHIAHLSLDDLARAVADATERARKKHKDLKFVEVEADSLEQLERLLQAPIDIVLLDNMSNEQLRSAVAMRDRTAPHIELEASGGVTLETVRGIAETGVDRISVGALTHSAKALDIGLDIA